MVDFNDLTHTVDPDIFTAGEDYAKRFSGAVGEFFLERQRNSVLSILAESERITGELDNLRIGSCESQSFRTRYLNTDKTPNPSTLRVYEILELGGGHCQLTDSLVEAGHRVSVHASRPEGLERVRVERTVTFPLNQLAEHKNDYDVVIAMRLLPHVLDWEELIRAMAKKAKRGIVFDIAAIRGFNALSPMFFGVKQKIEGNTRPYLLHKLTSIASLLEELELRNVVLAPQFFLPMGIHRKLGIAGLSRNLESIAGSCGLVNTFGNPVIIGAFRTAPV